MTFFVGEVGMGRLGMIVGVLLGIGLVVGGIVLAVAPHYRATATVAANAPAAPAVATEQPAPTAVPIPTIPPCATEARAFIDTAKPMAERWDDAAKLAGSTSRMSLAPQIASMQAIRRDAQALEAPPCAEQSKQYLLEAMDKTIDAYIAFLGQQPDTIVQASFLDAGDAMKRYQNEIALLTGATIEKDPLAEQYTSNRSLYLPLGYDLQRSIEMSGEVTWRGESKGVSLVITPNADGTIKAVRVAGSDKEQMAKTAQIAIPTWANAQEWLNDHASNVTVSGKVNGAMVTYSHDGGIVTIDLYPETPTKSA